jgi:protein-glutamine gamma-glutamyltransferase
MASKDSVMLRWSTAALIMSGYLALSAVPHIGPAVLVPPLIFIACARGAEYLHKTVPAYAVITRAVTVAYLCFLPLTIISLDILPAVTLLVCFIQVYTLLHQKQARNYYHLHLMSLFLLLAACVQTPDPAIGLIMVVFLVSAVWASLALRLAAEADRAGSATDPEIVGLDNLDQQAIHGKGDLGRVKIPLLAVALSLLAVLSTAFLFMLTPRIEAGMFGRGQQVVETTGLSDAVDLSSGSTIIEDTTPVMMIRFPDVPGGQASDESWLYWRVTTLSKYENNSWQRLRTGLHEPGIAHTERSGNGVSNENAELMRSPRDGKELVRQLIYMDTIPENGIPVMHLAQRVRITEQAKGKRLRWGRDSDYTVVLDKTGAVRRLNYEAWSEPGFPSAEALRTAPDYVPESDSARAANLLRHGLSADSVALASQITLGAENTYDKAIAIQSYLSGPDFLYSLNIPDMGTGSVIDVFINTTKLGHCQLFATAMSLMLRSQGVPSRVVSGYRGGEWQDSDKAYTIRANMAHLWVEVWFPDYGWVIFDPSPQPDYSTPSTIEQFSLLVSHMVLRSKMFWFQEVVGFDKTTQIERVRESSLAFIRGFSSEPESPDAPLDSPVEGGGNPLPILLLLCLTMLGGLWLGYRNRSGRPVNEFVLSRDQVQVVKLYLAFRRRLNKYGIDCRGKTAEELRDVLAAEQWGAPDAAMRLIACYNTVRFGGAPLQPGQLTSLKAALKELRPLDAGSAVS